MPQVPTPEREAGPVPPRPPRERPSAARLALAALGLVAVAVAARSLGGRLPALVAWIDGLGALGPLVFVVTYVVATVCFVPGSALTLAAGALFGVGSGLAYAFTAATLGAAAAFLVSRHLARGAVEQRIAGNERFAAIDRAVGREGRKIVFLLRLSPVFPFAFLNYALGLTRVGFGDFVLGSVGMLPGTLLYVSYGSALGLAAQAAGGVAPQRGPAEWAVLALGLLATVAVTVLVTRVARRALTRATEV